MWGGHSMFCFLCFGRIWFSIRDSGLSLSPDWESYFGSPFSLLSVWVGVFVRGTIALVSFKVVFVISCFVWRHFTK